MVIKPPGTPPGFNANLGYLADPGLAPEYTGPPGQAGLLGEPPSPFADPGLAPSYTGPPGTGPMLEQRQDAPIAPTAPTLPAVPQEPMVFPQLMERVAEGAVPPGWTPGMAQEMGLAGLQTPYDFQQLQLQEGYDWQDLDVPPEMVPAVMSYARRSGIDPETIRRQHPLPEVARGIDAWLEVFPKEERAAWRKQANYLRQKRMMFGHTLPDGEGIDRGETDLQTNIRAEALTSQDAMVEVQLAQQGLDIGFADRATGETPDLSEINSRIAGLENDLKDKEGRYSDLKLAESLGMYLGSDVDTREELGAEISETKRQLSGYRSMRDRMTAEEGQPRQTPYQVAASRVTDPEWADTAYMEDLPEEWGVHPSGMVIPSYSRRAAQLKQEVDSLIADTSTSDEDKLRLISEIKRNYRLGADMPVSRLDHAIADLEREVTGKLQNQAEVMLMSGDLEGIRRYVFAHGYIHPKLLEMAEVRLGEQLPDGTIAPGKSVWALQAPEHLRKEYLSGYIGESKEDRQERVRQLAPYAKEFLTAIQVPNRFLSDHLMSSIKRQVDVGAELFAAYERREVSEDDIPALESGLEAIANKPKLTAEQRQEQAKALRESYTVTRRMNVHDAALDAMRSTDDPGTQATAAALSARYPHEIRPHISAIKGIDDGTLVKILTVDSMDEAVSMVQGLVDTPLVKILTVDSDEYYGSGHVFQAISALREEFGAHVRSIKSRVKQQRGYTDEEMFTAETWEQTLFAEDPVNREYGRPNYPDPGGIDSPSVLFFRKVMLTAGQWTVGEKALDSLIKFHGITEEKIALAETWSEEEIHMTQVRQAELMKYADPINHRMFSERIRNRHLPDNIASTSVSRMAWANESRPMPLEWAIPWFQSVFVASKRVIKQPVTPNEHRKAEAYKIFLAWSWRAQPAQNTQRFVNAFIVPYIEHIKQTEGKTLELKEAVARWDLSSVEYRRALRQMYMEMFLPPDQRSSFLQDIEIDSVKQGDLVTKFTSDSDIVRSSTFSLIEGNPWMSARGMRRFPIRDEAFDELYIKNPTEWKQQVRTTNPDPAFDLMESGVPYASAVAAVPVFQTTLGLKTRRAADLFLEIPNTSQLNTHFLAHQSIKRMGWQQRALAMDPEATGPTMLAHSNVLWRAGNVDYYDRVKSVLEREAGATTNWQDIKDFFNLSLRYSANANIQAIARLIYEGVYILGEGTVTAGYGLMSLFEPSDPLYDVHIREDGSRVLVPTHGSDTKEAMERYLALNDPNLTPYRHRFAESARSLESKGETIAFAFRGIARHYAHVFQDFDSFMGYAANDPVGALLDIATGAQLLGVIKVPLGGIRTPYAQKVRQFQNWVRQETKGAPPEGVLGKLRDFTFKVDPVEVRPILVDPANRLNTVHVDQRGNVVALGPRDWLLTPSGRTASSIFSQRKVQWVSLRELVLLKPLTRLGFIGNNKLLGRGMPSWAHTGSRHFLTWIGKTQRLLDSNWPILGPALTYGNKTRIRAIANGSPLGTMFSYTAPTKATLGEGTRFILEETENGIRKVTLTSHVEKAATIDGIARQTLRNDPWRSIQAVADHIDGHPIDLNIPTPENAVITITHGGRKLRVNLVEVMEEAAAYWTPEGAGMPPWREIKNNQPKPASWRDVDAQQRQLDLGDAVDGHATRKGSENIQTFDPDASGHAMHYNPAEPGPRTPPQFIKRPLKEIVDDLMKQQPLEDILVELYKAKKRPSGVSKKKWAKQLEAEAKQIYDAQKINADDFRIEVTVQRGSRSHQNQTVVLNLEDLGFVDKHGFASKHMKAAIGKIAKSDRALAPLVLIQQQIFRAAAKGQLDEAAMVWGSETRMVPLRLHDGQWVQIPVHADDFSIQLDKVSVDLMRAIEADVIGDLSRHTKHGDQPIGMWVQIADVSHDGQMLHFEGTGAVKAAAEAPTLTPGIQPHILRPGIDEVARYPEWLGDFSRRTTQTKGNRHHIAFKDPDAPNPAGLHSNDIFDANFQELFPTPGHYLDFRVILSQVERESTLAPTAPKKTRRVIRRNTREAVERYRANLDRRAKGVYRFDPDAERVRGPAIDIDRDLVGLPEEKVTRHTYQTGQWVFVDAEDLGLLVRNNRGVVPSDGMSYVMMQQADSLLVQTRNLSDGVSHADAAGLLLDIAGSGLGPRFVAGSLLSDLHNTLVSIDDLFVGDGLRPLIKVETEKMRSFVDAARDANLEAALALPAHSLSALKAHEIDRLMVNTFGRDLVRRTTKTKATKRTKTFQTPRGVERVEHGVMGSTTNLDYYIYYTADGAPVTLERLMTTVIDSDARALIKKAADENLFFYGWDLTDHPLGKRLFVDWDAQARVMSIERRLATAKEALESTKAPAERSWGSLGETIGEVEKRAANAKEARELERVVGALSDELEVARRSTTGDSRHLERALERARRTMGDSDDALKAGDFGEDVSKAGDYSRTVNLERFKRNPKAAVHAALATLDYKSRSAFLAWLYDGTIPLAARKDLSILQSWVDAGLADLSPASQAAFGLGDVRARRVAQVADEAPPQGALFDEAQPVQPRPTEPPQMIPDELPADMPGLELSDLGYGAGMYAIDYTHQYYKTAGFHAMLKNKHHFLGDAWDFYNWRQYLPKEHHWVVEMFGSTLTDARSALAMDAVEFNRLGGYSGSASATAAAQRYVTTTYLHGFEQAMRAADPALMVRRHFAHSVKRKYETLAEMHKAQGTRGAPILLRTTAFDAFMFSRVQLKAGIGRMQTMREALKDGRVVLAKRMPDGTFTNPNPKLFIEASMDELHSRLSMEVDRKAHYISHPIRKTLGMGSAKTIEQLNEKFAKSLKSLEAKRAKKLAKAKEKGRAKAEEVFERDRQNLIDEWHHENARLSAKDATVDEAGHVVLDEDFDFRYMFGDLGEAEGKLFIRKDVAKALGFVERYQMDWINHGYTMRSGSVLAGLGTGPLDIAKSFLDRPSLLVEAPAALLGEAADIAARTATTPLEFGYQSIEALTKSYVVRQFKKAKLFHSLWGPATRNMFANSMATLRLHPEMVRDKLFWKGFQEYWSDIRYGNFEVSEAAMEIVSSGVVQAGISLEAGFQHLAPHARKVADDLGVIADEAIAQQSKIEAARKVSDDLHALQRSHADLDLATRLHHWLEKEGAAIFEQYPDFISRLDPVLDVVRRETGDTAVASMRELLDAAVDSGLADNSKRGITRKLFDAVADFRQYTMPNPWKVVTGRAPETRFMKKMVQLFNDTDDSFKYAVAYYYYHQKGLRGSAMFKETMKSWPDYSQIADWERIYTGWEVFGTYETKYAMILGRAFAENPAIANALRTAHQMMMMGELSDPDTMRGYFQRPGYRWDAMMQTPLGLIDMGMFNIVSSARLEHTAMNNPWYQLLLAVLGKGGASAPFWGGEDLGMFNITSNPWQQNLLRTMTDTFYGSGQINMAELGFNLLADHGQYSERAGSLDSWFVDLIKNRLLARTAEASGPRLSAFFAALANEPYPIGQDRMPVTFWEAFIKLFTGLQRIAPDEDFVRKKLGKTRATIRDLIQDYETQNRRDVIRSTRQRRQATVPVREIVRRQKTTDDLENEYLAVTLAGELGYKSIPNMLRIVEEARSIALDTDQSRTDLTDREIINRGREIIINKQVEQQNLKYDNLQNMIKQRQGSF